MKCAIQVMDSTGHTTLEWTTGDAGEEARMRELVATMQQAGYTFFVVDGAPADAVSAGGGKLIVRRLEDPVAEMNAEASSLNSETVAVNNDATESEPRRRGRPRKQQPATEAVAVRRMAGG